MILTKEEILKYANLNVREIKAFGGTVKIRSLSIKEMQIATQLPEGEIIAQMVSYALVEPKMSIKDIGALGIEALGDLTKIVNALSGKQDGED